jgi:diguanylate cyclase (GGDEF)-like protein
MSKTAQDEASLEQRIATLLEREEYSGHALREALAELFNDYREHRARLERLASISDGYQSIMLDSKRSLLERYDKQVRHLEKLVRISDHYQKNLQELNEALRVASLHDPLTNLPNRRLIIESLQHETSAVERGRKTFSLMIFDVDYFKAINDGWGHEAGDAALIAIAESVKHSLRAYDVCARWGGEEFLILLPETTGEKALEIAERLLTQINELSLPNLPETRKLTVSIGVASHEPKTDFAQTIKRADDALFQAKREGRNRAALWKA